MAQKTENFQKPKLRVPPQNTEAESALLGSIMLRPEAINEIIDFVNADSFYSERHRIIFKTMMELFSKSTPIDLLSISSRLGEKNMLEQVGGASFLAEIVQGVPSSTNAKHYSEIVQKKYMMRNLINAAEYISELGFDESADLEEMLDKAEKSIFEVTNYSGVHKFIELKDTLGEAWERLDKLHNSKDVLRGVPTGFKDLDSKLSGLQKSDLIILAARPSMGKTSLALDIARQAAVNHKVPVGIFSLEMSSQQLVDRMLSSASSVDSWKLRTGKGLSLENDFSRIRTAMDTLSQAPIYIDDQPGNNILKMRSVARRLKSEKGLSRAVEARGGKPRLSDLRDSGSIEQDADVVMFIHREDKYNENSDRPNIAEIMIEKHRNGPTGKVELYFREEKASFESMAKGDFSDFEKSADF